MKGLIKIAPVVVIVACAASLFFAFKVSGIKNDLQDRNAKLDSDLAASRNKVTQIQAELGEVQTKLRDTENDLMGVRAKLGAAEVEIAQKQRTLEELNGKVAQAEQEATQAREQQAAAEAALQPLKEKIAALEELDVEELAAKNRALTDENELLGQQMATLQNAKKALEQEIVNLKETPYGTRGTVALSRSDWNLIVLDIGLEDKVRENAEFLVYRDSKLIAKARITTVNQNNSVAELVPGFIVGQPKEGDLAVLAAKSL